MLNLYLQRPEALKEKTDPVKMNCLTNVHKSKIDLGLNESIEVHHFILPSYKNIPHIQIGQNITTPVYKKKNYSGH